MKRKQRKTFEISGKKAIDEEAGIYEVMISTEAVDRDGDIVEAAGADISSYTKNPVVLFGHKYSDPEAVVGKALEIVKQAGKGIRAKFQFAPWGTSAGADAVRRLWSGGFLNATSIGFRVPDGGWEEIVTESDNGESRRTGWRFITWELLEFSIVPVPANQEALRLAIKAIKDEGGVSVAELEDDLIKAISGKKDDPTDEDLDLIDDDEIAIETDDEEEEDLSDPTIDEDNELTDDEEASLEEAVAYLEEVLDELALSISSEEERDNDD